MRIIGRLYNLIFWALVEPLIACVFFGFHDGPRIWWRSKPPVCRFCRRHVDCAYGYLMCRCNADRHSHQECVIEYAEKRELP